MSWLHPLFLLGLGAVSVPILLHFWGRKPIRIEILPTIDLLRRALQKHLRRSRFRELLLLLLRSCLIIFATFTVARPLIMLTGNKTIDRARSTKLILLDNSVSMNVKAGRFSNFEKAVTQVEAFLDRSNPEDEIALHLLLEEGEGSILGFTNDRERIQRKLKGATIRYQEAFITERLLEIIPREKRSKGSGLSIWIFTDGTAHPWRGVEQVAEIDVPVHLVDVSSSKSTPNYSLGPIIAKSHWSSQKDVWDLEANIYTNQLEKGRVQVSLEQKREDTWEVLDRKFIERGKGEAMTISFPYVPTQEVEIGRLRLDDDALEDDNVAFFVAHREPSVKVLLVNGNVRPEARESATYFVAQALRPDPEEGGSDSTSQFEIEEWTPDRLTNKTDLEDYSVVMLIDAGGITDLQFERVRTFVENGGILFVSLGSTYLQLEKKYPIQEILPINHWTPSVARSTEKEGLAPPLIPNSFPELEDRWKKLLGSAQVRQRFMVRPSNESHTWLRFESGAPAFLSHPWKKGKVALWTTSFDRRWTDLPLATGFPTLLQLLLRKLVQETRERQFATSSVPVRALISPKDVGGERSQNLRIEALGVPTWKALQKGEAWIFPGPPNVWSVSTLDQSVIGEKFFVTAFTSTEIQLEPYNLKTIGEHLTLKQDRSPKYSKHSSPWFSGERGSVEISKWFAWLILVLFLLESLVAGRWFSTFWQKKVSGSSVAVLLLAPFIMGLSATSLHAFESKSLIKIGQVSYPKGVRPPYRRPWEHVLRKVERMANVTMNPRMENVTLKSTSLFNYPFLYWGGESRFELPSTQELQQLRNHLTAGGFLFFDDATGNPKGGFGTSVVQLLKAIFPETELQPLPKDHPLFRSFFLLERPHGRLNRSMRLMGLGIGRRVAVVYFAGDLAGALEQELNGKFLHTLEDGYRQRTQALRFGVNTIFYALTLNYKKDQIHLPYILERRR